VELALLVGCAGTKSAQPQPGLLAREYANDQHGVKRWAAAVRGGKPQVALRELYGGQLWRDALRLESVAVATGWSTRLWVASAGLGLASADSAAPAYSATFSSPHVDAVGTTASERRRWWVDLNEAFARPNLREVRHEIDALLVVLSPPYLKVVMPDLPGSAVLVVSSAMDSAPSSPQRVSTSGLRGWLGGSQMTLNTRVAAEYLRVTHGLGLASEAASAAWQSHVAGKRAAPANTHRTTSDDEEVLAWIRQQHPLSSATPMLRAFREGGRACEQQRFARLHRALVTT